MAAAKFGQCMCGWPKSEHAPEAFRNLEGANAAGGLRRFNTVAIDRNATAVPATAQRPGALANEKASSEKSLLGPASAFDTRCRRSTWTGEPASRAREFRRPPSEKNLLGDAASKPAEPAPSGRAFRRGPSAGSEKSLLGEEGSKPAEPAPSGRAFRRGPSALTNRPPSERSLLGGASKVSPEATRDPPAPLQRKLTPSAFLQQRSQLKSVDTTRNGAAKAKNGGETEHDQLSLSLSQSFQSMPGLADMLKSQRESNVSDDDSDFD